MIEAGWFVVEMRKRVSSDALKLEQIVDDEIRDTLERHDINVDVALTDEWSEAAVDAIATAYRKVGWVVVTEPRRIKLTPEVKP